LYVATDAQIFYLIERSANYDIPDTISQSTCVSGCSGYPFFKASAFKKDKSGKRDHSEGGGTP
jgi:hypothetical protein